MSEVMGAVAWRHGSSPRLQQLLLGHRVRTINLSGMKKTQDLPDKITDEPGMEERFQRTLRNLVNIPPKHRAAPTPKPKERRASKGRVHKGRTRT
jgi:hypothetical protein